MAVHLNEGFPMPRKKRDENLYTIPDSFAILPATGRQAHSYDVAVARLERLCTLFKVMSESGDALETNQTSLAIAALDRVDDVARNILDRARLKVDNQGGSADSFETLVAMAGLDEPCVYEPPMNATPAAAGIIIERELDVDSIAGTMPGGKVSVDDVHRYLQRAFSEEEKTDDEGAGADGGGPQ